MINAIITDIQGTTSSLTFEHDVLSPYAKENITDYVFAMHDDADVVEQLEQVNQEVGKKLSLGEAVQQLLQWINEDKEVTSLNALKSLVWEAGYRTGEFTGHVYADAARMMTNWNDNGIAIYIYASDSVRSQQLLFGFSDFGDQTENLTGYFDIRTGDKCDPASYQRILNKIHILAGGVLFLSDTKEELDAAKAAGMQTGWLVRDVDNIDSDAEHKQFKSFSEIDLDLF